MSVKQTIYFMALVGALAGLLCWILQVFASDFVVITRASQQFWLVGLYAAIMGALVAGMTVGFADHWSSDKAVPTWIAAGALLGAVAGGLTGLLYGLAAPQLLAGDGRAGRIVPWVIAGGLIGLATGLRWASVNAIRIFHAFLGGLLGGGVGGIVYTLLGDQPFLQALAYMFIGTGITMGVTLAPVLLSDGVLQFVSSGDPRAQNKYGPPRQEWVIQDGDQLVVGSQSASMTSTMYAQAVHVYVPDAMVSPRHAVLLARKKRFYVQLHPENANQVGQPLQPLLLGDETVTGNGRELRNGDEIVVGQTLLRFLTRRKPSGPADDGGPR